jgi:hypothetical protein
MGLRFEADASGKEGVGLWVPDGHPAAEYFAAVGYDSTGDDFRFSALDLAL